MKTYSKIASAIGSILVAGAMTALLACDRPVDIKPTSCPNPINVDKGGITPVAILGVDPTKVWVCPDHDTMTIKDIVVFVDTGGLTNGNGWWGNPEHFASAKRHNLEDVATPDDDLGCGATEDACGTDGPDGFVDTTAKFKNSELVEAIEAVEGPLEDGQLVCVTVMAVYEREDGSEHRHHGVDVIRINKKK